MNILKNPQAAQGGNEALKERQESRWQPIIDWFNDRHQAQIMPSRQSVLESPQIPNDSRAAVRRYLLSLSLDALHGFATGVDALKSVVLMSGVVDKIISVEDAVKLARLELEVQVGWLSVLVDLLRMVHGMVETRRERAC